MSETPANPKSEELARAEKVLAADAPAAEGAAGHDAPAEHAPAPAAAHKPEKKHGTKKKKGSKKPPLKERVIESFKETGQQILEIFQGVVSPDRPTRRMSLVFILSLSGLLIVSTLTLKRMLLPPAAPRVVSEESHESAEGAHGQSEGHGGHSGGHAEGHGESHGEGHGESHGGGHEMTMLDLGSFSVELKPSAGAPKSAHQVDMADITLVLECDSPDTYTFIEQRIPEARNQLTNVFLRMDREELLTRDGKYRLKARILDQLNTWLPKGKVHNVFISRLIVG